MSAEDEEASREVVLRLLSEDLTVERTVASGDIVRVRTVTGSSERHVKEMLRHQTADVKRVPIDREIEDMPEIRQQGDLTILPVVKEVLVLHRQLVLVEEIHIRAVTTDEPFAATVTLREQRAEIIRNHPVGGIVAAGPAEITKE